MFSLTISFLIDFLQIEWKQKFICLNFYFREKNLCELLVSFLIYFYLTLSSSHVYFCVSHSFSYLIL